MQVFTPDERVIIVIEKDHRDLDISIRPHHKGVRLQEKGNHIRIQYTPKRNEIKLINGINIKSRKGCLATDPESRGLYFSIPLSYELDDMNKTIKSTLDNLNGAMKHVFMATPVQDQWSVTQIMSELTRSGRTYSHSSVTGCLNALRERKLIKENQGSYTRTLKESIPTIENKALSYNHTAPAIIEEPLMSSHKKAPLELLAELSAKARELAEALDNAALEIEQSFQNSEAQTVKLKQLQSLLKDIAE